MCLGHTQPLFFGDVCLFNSNCDLIKGIDSEVHFYETSDRETYRPGGHKHERLPSQT